MTPATLRHLESLRTRNTAQTTAIRSRLDRYVLDRWNQTPAWRDENLPALLNDIIPAVNAAERAMVDQTTAYTAATRAVATGRPFRPPTPDYRDTTGTALRGVEPDELFRRPQKVLNYQLSIGATVAAAVTAGGRRLSSLATTNVQLAKTRTIAKQGTTDFYRRVLTGNENCALCVIASTQRYRMGGLAPIHPGCDCDWEELHGQPPLVIDQELLNHTHAAIAEKFGDSDLWAQDLGLGKRDAKDRPVSDYTELIITRQHGELGPVLSWRKDHFRGPAEAAALAN